MTTKDHIPGRRLFYLLIWAGVLGAFIAAPRAAAQGKAAKAPLSGKAGAVIDITGNWVSIIDEDWLWRMATPAKGDTASLPVNAKAIQVTRNWNPDKDKAEGNECRAYGAGNIMRIPGRLHITWADDNTLQMEIDAGMQKRLFHFGDAQWKGGAPQWQGFSTAIWEKQFQVRASNPGRVGFGGPEPGTGGNLAVVTTHMRPGYLRKNGVPYSGNAVLTEYFNVVTSRGETYMLLTSILKDPEYLLEPYVVSSQFKREADASKWDPQPCRPLWPLQVRRIIPSRQY
ncbi:MAG TPA: hypothetical protein VG892_02450 [Terriglobales bacterium]|nr:hypothetical protein [Terriglobales bacterium]